MKWFLTKFLCWICPPYRRHKIASLTAMVQVIHTGIDEGRFTQPVWYQIAKTFQKQLDEIR